MVTERPGVKSSYFTITVHYKSEDGDGFLVHSVKGTETQYSIPPGAQMCWDISKNGFMMEVDDHSIWIPNHRVVSVRLDRKEADA